MDWLLRAGRQIVVLSALPPHEALNRLRSMAHHGDLPGGWMVPRPVGTSPWFVVVNSDAGGTLGLGMCRAEKDRYAWTNMRVHAEPDGYGGSRLSLEPRYARYLITYTLGGIAVAVVVFLFGLVQLLIGRGDATPLIISIVFAAFALSGTAYLRWIARDRLRLLVRWVTANQPRG